MKCSECKSPATAWSKTIPFCSEHFPKYNKNNKKKFIKTISNKKPTLIQKLTEETNA